MKRAGRRSLSLAGSLLLSSLAGCDENIFCVLVNALMANPCGARSDVEVGIRESGYVPPPKATTPHGRQRFQVELTASASATGTVGDVIALGWPLSEGFRWRLTGRVADFPPLAGGGSFGARLVVAASDPAVFVELRARTVGTGMTVTASNDAGALGEIVLAGALLVDLELTRTDGEIVLAARHAGYPAATEVARLPAPAGTLHPGVFVDGLGAGDQVVLSDLSFEDHAPAALPQDPVDRAVALTRRAFASQFSALTSLQATGSPEQPGIAASLPSLADARAALAEARRVAWTGEGAGPKKATRRLAAAARQAKSAGRRLRPDRPLDPVTKRLRKAVQLELLALTDLRRAQ